MDCRPFPPRQEDEEAAQNSSLMSYVLINNKGIIRGRLHVTVGKFELKLIFDSCEGRLGVSQL
jgi:hypothetical protein